MSPKPPPSVGAASISSVRACDASTGQPAVAAETWSTEDSPQGDRAAGQRAGPGDGRVWAGGGSQPSKLAPALATPVSPPGALGHRPR